MGYRAVMAHYRAVQWWAIEQQWHTTELYSGGLQNSNGTLQGCTVVGYRAVMAHYRAVQWWAIEQ